MRKAWKFRASALLLVLLFSACIRIGGCREEAPFDGAEVRVHFDVKPEKGYQDVYAEVFLDGNLVGSVGNEDNLALKVSSGKHQLKLDAPKHIAEEKTITIMNSNRQEFHFLLYEHE